MQIITIILIIGFCNALPTDNSCMYKHSTKGVINLSSVGLRNGQPRFQDLSDSIASIYTYSFNPCYSFTEHNCNDAAICQISSDGQYAFKLGMQNVSQWTLDSNMAPVLTYVYGSKMVSITMICSATVEDELEILGEYASNKYSMRLRSRCACWNGCISPEPTASTARTSPVTQPWIYYNECKYRDSRYGMIDLTSIGNVTGTPKFKDIKSTYPSNFMWSYNPCYKFSEDSCHDVAGCQIDQTSGVSYTIGLQENARWINMNKSTSIIPSIIYFSPNHNRRLTVKLICDLSISSHRLKVIGETSLGQYVMELTSPCACWDGCIHPTPTPTPPPITWKFWMTICAAGIILFLLFFSMITCLFCSKPKSKLRFSNVAINEKTPLSKAL